jgi:hypothetical protein
MAKAAAFSRSAIQRKATSARAVPCATTTLSRHSVACQAHAHQQIGIAFAPRRDKVPLALLARRKRIAFVRQQLGIGDVLPAPECELRQPRVGAIAQGCARPSERARHEVEGTGIAPHRAPAVGGGSRRSEPPGPDRARSARNRAALQPALPVAHGLAVPDVEEEGCLH